MHDKPSGAIDERATTAAQDIKDRARVLREVLDLYPETLTLEELVRELTIDSVEFEERDRVQRAVRDLIAGGLIHRVGNLVLPTRAAVNFQDLSRVADVEIEGIPLKDRPLRELRRRHTLALVDHMLRTEGRATTGAVGILRALSAMAEDAITDEVCDLNPFKGVRIRANDPRAKKKPRPIRVFTFEAMHRFAKAAGRYEAMVRVFTDCGLRLGEVLPLRASDFDGEMLQVRRTAHEGQILEGTKTDHGEPDAGRVVPVPATLAWMLQAQINLNGPDCQLLFPTPRGRLWRERTFYRDLWKPAQKASDLDIRPHECCHAYVTHLRAAGVNDADLAEIVGHGVETMLARYTHAVGKSSDAVRQIIK
jgi:integrase